LRFTTRDEPSFFRSFVKISDLSVSALPNPLALFLDSSPTSIKPVNLSTLPLEVILSRRRWEAVVALSYKCLGVSAPLLGRTLPVVPSLYTHKGSLL